MTKLAYTARHRHDSDAEFRLWGSLFSSKLALVGLVQTADTGQINWTTVVRAAAGVSAGYEIWRFNDAMQSTAPIYIRFEYWTSTANAGGIYATVGTGTDGAGNLTGLIARSGVATNNGVMAPNAAMVIENLYRNYLCCVNGFFGMSMNNDPSTAQISSQAWGALFVCRTVDADQTPNATGVLVIWTRGSNLNSHALRFASPSADYGFQAGQSRQNIWSTPQSRESSMLVDGNIQANLGFTVTPKVEPVPWVFGVLLANFPTGNTFTCIPMGTLSRTYISVNNIQVSSSLAGILHCAMLWE